VNCYYCDQIVRHDPAYRGAPAAFDLGSEAPRCPRHWRYICAHCGQPKHFMACAYDDQAGRFFCSDCAEGRQEVAGRFWHWEYWWQYRSPWTKKWYPALDRAEFERRHPMQLDPQRAQTSISAEPYLVRYPPQRVQWRADEPIDDETVGRNWNANAARWNSRYDADGDQNRRYQSDEPMLAMLGEVRGLNVLDAGCGQGYLCRKLAAAGARMTGVEQSDALLSFALQREAEEKRGITYHHGSIADMPFLADASFDKAVANYVLMDVRECEKAVAEIHRVLKPGGVFVAVISHGCFSSGDSRWYAPAADSPRHEDRAGILADKYFHRGPIYSQWGDLDPVLGFHRPIRDYWQTFTQAGFRIDGFEEPSITDRGRRELPVSVVQKALRIPYSYIFRLVKADAPRTGTR